MNANPPVHLLAAFQQTYPNLISTWVIQAPGRETWVAAVAAHETEGYCIASANHQTQTKFSRRTALSKQTLLHRPLPSWSRYAAGVIVALSEFDVPGIRAVSSSDDTSFGPRHDHALGMAFATLWHEICGRPYTPESILDIVEKVRRNYVEG